jgi:AmmeMemoRadiSam system protein A/AmmeMemoRadiSam system protein B
MSIIAGYLLPHPPIILAEIGRGEERKISRTVEAYRAAASEIAQSAPDTIIIISPHSQGFSDGFYIPAASSASGDLAEFDAPNLKVELEYDTEFTDLLAEICQYQDFPALASPETDHLDHAVVVPARFIAAALKRSPQPQPKFVHLTISDLSPETHREFGQIIAQTADQLGRKTAVVASGDLSHRLLDSGPYGFSPAAAKFDQAILDIVKAADFTKLYDITPDFRDQAGECGYRPIAILAGVLDKKSFATKLLSYEGPFGVGYAVASFSVSQSPFVKLARQTAEKYVLSGQVYYIPNHAQPKSAPSRAGVFVSIKKLGDLRGCIGTISPTAENLAAEIRNNAISAASQDPRFRPITANELPFLTYSVDILSAAQPVDDVRQLDPKTHGIIVSLGDKQGLLLPDIDGVDSVWEQIAIAMEKADIAWADRDKIKLKYFTVKRYY